MMKYTTNAVKKRPYLFFLIKLCILFSLVFVLDLCIGTTLRYFYFKQESGMQYRSTYAMEKTTADVLIMGSSRANHHYHPDVFEERLNMSFYNAGRDANRIFYHYAVLKAVLKRYTPRIVILNFVHGEFLENPATYDRISSLLPYYKDHPEIRSIIELKGPYEKLKLLSAIYPFNSSLFTIAAGNSEFNKTRRGDVKGYVPLEKKWDGPQRIESGSFEYKLDSIKIKILEDFIHDCKKAGVKLYIACSPLYIRPDYTDPSIVHAKKIATRNNIPFFDHSQDTTFLKSPHYFYDYTHLNDDGAKAFSTIIIDQMRQTEQ